MSQQSPVPKEKFQRYPLFGVPQGYDSVFLAKLARDSGSPVIHVCSDDLKFEEILEALRFFGADVETLRFPAWDCFPYDRISPTYRRMGERLRALSRLLHGAARPMVILTTVAAVSQRIRPRGSERRHLQRARGNARHASRCRPLCRQRLSPPETVREAGEYDSRKPDRYFPVRFA